MIMSMTNKGEAIRVLLVAKTMELLLAYKTLKAFGIEIPGSCTKSNVDVSYRSGANMNPKANIKGTKVSIDDIQKQKDNNHETSQDQQHDDDEEEEAKSN